MRLFVALELPPTARGALSAWAAERLAAGLRVIPSADLHVTLCFLGERPGTDVAPLAETMTAAMAGTPPLELILGASLGLPPRRPRVLAVAIDAPEAILTRGARGGAPGTLGALQAHLAATLAAGGWYRPERRRFLAHVTVARVRSREPGAAHAPLTAPRTASTGIRFRATEVALIRSRLDAGPARYERLATATLSPPAA